MARILIIDDRPVNRQFLTALLGYGHHDLREASDGAEGLRIAREHHPDLIISDVLMPTMDGYEFVHRLREDPAIGKTPVVFSTAHYLSRESQALALKCGVTSIIYKPCEPQVVLDIVAAALGGRADPQLPAVTEPEDFDREHLQLLTNKLSEKAEQLRDAHGKLTALMELSTDLAKERDPAELLDRYCSVAREVIGARWTMVALLDGDRKTVRHLGTVGIDVEDTPALRSELLQTGVFATVTKEGRPICLSDVTSTPATLRLPDSLPRAGSLLVAPLAIRGHVDGWICLADKLGFDAFSEQDEQLAAAFAAKVAVAYDNARLYSESTKYAIKLETEISERVRAERELSESKARLAGIIGSAMDSIITVDSDQRIVMFNKAAEKMFRCTAAEVIGQGLDRFIPPRFRPSHAKDIRTFGGTGVTTRAMAATRPVSGLRADGEEFPMEASISQIEVGGQKLYTVIMRDIIEKTRALEALRASELRYRRLFESAKDGILILDAVSGQIVEANPFLIEMLGYSKDDLLGKELWEIGAFKDIVASRDAFEELQRHGYIRYEDLPLKTHEGVAKQVEFVSNSYLAGSIRVIQCNIRDITERRRAEKALLESQRRLDFALQKSHTGGWDLDLVDLTLHRTLEHDRIFGYSTLLPEWTYEMFLEHVLPEDRTEVDRRFRQAVATQTAWSFECRIRRPDGDVRWIWASGEHQGDRNGKPERLSGIVQDITERKRAEEALRSKIEELAATTQQLWQASKLATMGELAASIAHELNNPLATVGLRTESLLMQLPEESDQRKPLEIISQEVDRMATLVNNLLQFSRRSHRQVSTVDPREEIATSVEFVQYHLRSHNIEVVREFADVLPSIQADRQQLRQLFLNLLTNASDAMPQGGKLTVRAGSNGFGDAAVAIDFADSGEGITSENLERVWDPFFTTKPEGKGTGLGLAICRRIVEEHGGTISIQSGGTDGTTVRIVLPATGSGGLS